MEHSSITLGALTANGIVIADSDVLLDMDFRILKSEVTAVIRAMTSLEGQGLLLYMTEGDLTAAEAEEKIELDGPRRMGDQVAEEMASRWVRLFGITTGPTVNETERVFRNKYGGGILELNPRWTFRRGRTVGNGGWNWACYNSGATITTGAIVDIVATHYGVWVA